MKNRLLLPMDGSESIDEILIYVRTISPRSNTDITLLHVLPHGAGSGKPNAVAEIHPHVNIVHDALEKENWSVEREIRMGDPVEEIVKQAVLMPATLLMMSTHGRSGLERIREGSVTEQVLKQSPCPIFILHSGRPEPAELHAEDLFQRILVPLDGTDASAAILECVERFAKAHDSEVILFHDELEGMEAKEDASAIKHILEEHSVQLANAGLKVALDMTTYRRPIREILNKIDEYNIDLVSMASHGSSGTRRSLDESVTAEVIRHANCPLLVWSAAPQCPPL